MAEMTINIISPNIDLMANKSSRSNSCYTFYNFDINTTNGATIEVNVERLNTNVEDYDYIGIGIDGKWQKLNNGTSTFTLPNGKASMEVIIGNVTLNEIKNGEGTCNQTRVTVSDTTNNESESNVFYRCDTQMRCLELDGTNNSYTPQTDGEITEDTNILIYFDGSGSMNNTLPALQSMRDNQLKSKLITYYNNDTNYNNKVKVVTINDIGDPAYERTFKMLNYEGQNLQGNVICLVFQDEADEYTGAEEFNAYANRSPNYDEDLSVFRQRLLSFDDGYYNGVVFQVTQDNFDGINFKELLVACKNGVGKYSGTSGLSDKDNVIFKYDINEGGTDTYYMDLVTTALSELGIEI
jgi:hypothetical protein